MARKLKVQCKEMTDADVQYISLVPRGANRVPFRIVKEAMTMLDLTKVFKSSAPKVEAKLVAVAVKSTADTVIAKTDIDALVLEQGLSVKKMETLPEVNVFCFQEDMLGDVVTVKLSEEVALLFSGVSMIDTVRKGFESWGTGNDFLQNMQTNGFFPGVCMAADVLEETIRNIMWNASPGAAPTKEIAKALRDFEGYVSALLGAVPVTAFKLEKLVPVPVKTEDKPSETIAKKEDAVDTVKKDEKIVEAKKDEVKKDEGVAGTEGAPAAAEAATGVKKDEALTGEMSEDMAKKMQEMMGAVVTAALAPMVQKMDGLATEITSLKTELGAVKEQSAKAVEKAEKAETAVSGTVAMEPLQDTGLNSRQRTAKTDKETETGSVFGTAFKIPGIG